MSLSWVAYLLDVAGTAAQKPRAMNRVKNVAKSLRRLLDLVMVLIVSDFCKFSYE